VTPPHGPDTLDPPLVPLPMPPAPQPPPQQRPTSTDLLRDLRRAVGKLRLRLGADEQGETALLDAIVKQLNLIDELGVQAFRSGDFRPLIDALFELSRLTAISSELAGLAPLDETLAGLMQARVDPYTGVFTPLDLAIAAALLEREHGREFGNQVVQALPRVLPLDLHTLRQMLPPDLYAQIAHAACDPQRPGLYVPSHDLVLLRAGQSLADTANTLAWLVSNRG
jgi:hypothetical protein